MENEIKVKHPNGYSGILYGKRSKRSLLSTCERSRYMNIKKFSKLGKLERMCTLCNRDLEAKDIAENNYIETYKSYRYRLAHRTCYNNYLKYVKEVNQKCMK